MDARVEARDRDIDRVPGGNIALGLMVLAWIAVLAIYLDHRIVLTSDSMNNYVHVWGIAHDLWHHGHLPWRMPLLGHGDAFAYPYGFTNWTTAAIVWPVLGNWGVTLWTALGAVGCIVATFVAFPELRHGWWAAAVLANPAIIEAMLFGQQTFAWGAALLLFGVAAWRRNRPLLAAVLVGLGQATHAAIVLPIGVLLVLAYLPFAPDRRALLRWYALSLLIALPAVWLVFASPGYADSSMRDRLVNFFGTLGPRILVIALPLIFVLLRRTGIRVLAPLALVLALAVNVAFEQPLNVDVAVARNDPQREHRDARQLPALPAVRSRRDLPGPPRRGRLEARPVSRGARRRPARFGAVPRERGDAQLLEPGRVRAAPL